MTSSPRCTSSLGKWAQSPWSRCYSVLTACPHVLVGATELPNGCGAAVSCSDLVHGSAGRIKDSVERGTPGAIRYTSTKPQQGIVRVALRLGDNNRPCNRDGGLIELPWKVGPALWSADRREKVVACLPASLTCFGAEPAVFVVGSVPFTLLGTGEADHCTRFDDCADRAQIRRGLPSHDTARGVARVGAVEAEPNDADQLRQIILA